MTALATTQIMPGPAVGHPATVRHVDPAVARAQRGDTAAFEHVYRAHVGRVYALCLRLCGDGGKAEQLVQDVFFQAWRRLSTFRGECAFATWLHRLATNVVLQDHRANSRRLAREQASTQHGPTARSLDGATHASMDLERAIATLPERARMVFVLHDIEGHSHEEVAQMMRLAVGTSKTQLHRARKLLREALS